MKILTMILDNCAVVLNVLKCSEFPNEKTHLIDT